MFDASLAAIWRFVARKQCPAGTWNSDKLAFATFLALLRQVRGLAGSELRWRAETYEFESERPAIDLLLGRPELRPMLESATSIAEMEHSWAAELDCFRELRERFLAYP